MGRRKLVKGELRNSPCFEKALCYDAHHHSLIILTGAMAFIYKPDALQTKHDATRC